jgi:hypothetical protein
MKTSRRTDKDIFFAFIDFSGRGMFERAVEWTKGLPAGGARKGAGHWPAAITA